MQSISNIAHEYYRLIFHAFFPVFIFLFYCHHFYSLQIIRGRTLFKLNIYDEQFGLFVSYSQMDSLELPALRDILAGSVFIFNNQNLCHIQTINWDEIITGESLRN